MQHDQPVGQAPTWRASADIVHRWAATVGVVACGFQVAFAAYGFWVVQANPGDEEVGRAAFAMHGDTGHALGYLSLALLILGIITRVNRKAWLLPLVLAILLFAVQGPLVGLGFGVSPWFGGLHALDGMLITAGFTWLAYDRWVHPADH